MREHVWEGHSGRYSEEMAEKDEYIYGCWNWENWRGTATQSKKLGQQDEMRARPRQFNFKSNVRELAGGRRNRAGEWGCTYFVRWKREFERKLENYTRRVLLHVKEHLCVCFLNFFYCNTEEENNLKQTITHHVQKKRGNTFFFPTQRKLSLIWSLVPFVRSNVDKVESALLGGACHSAVCIFVCGYWCLFKKCQWHNGKVSSMTNTEKVFKLNTEEE